MTIFDHIGAIIFKKDKDVLTSILDESTFSPYMTNRWLSMYSPEMAVIVNTTTNKYTSIFPDKRDHFNMFVSLFPRVRQKRIQYIKQKSELEDKREETISLFAKQRELSQREVRDQLDLIELCQPSK